MMNQALKMLTFGDQGLLDHLLRQLRVPWSSFREAGDSFTKGRQELFERRFVIAPKSIEQLSNTRPVGHWLRAPPIGCATRTRFPTPRFRLKPRLFRSLQQFTAGMKPRSSRGWLWLCWRDGTGHPLVSYHDHTDEPREEQPDRGTRHRLDRRRAVAPGCGEGALRTFGR